MEEIGDYAFFMCENLTATPDLSKVKYIGEGAFAGVQDILTQRRSGTSITTVNIPDDAVVGDYAFAFNTKISSVTLGNRVKVGEGAFYTPIAFFRTFENYFAGLVKSMDYTVEQTPQAIEQFRKANGFSSFYTEYTYTPEGGDESYTYYRFNYKTSAYSNLKKVSIGDGAEIGFGAFMDNAWLNELTLGENVIIGDRAFYNCYDLAQADLSKVVEIGERAFSGEETIDFVVVRDSSGNRTYEFANEYAYVDGKRVAVNNAYSCAAPRITEANLSSVEALGTGAFAYNTALASVTFGDKLTAIPAYAFAYTNITEIAIPEKVVEIGSYAFVNTKITGVDLSNVTYIGAYAFADTELTKVTLNADAIMVDGEQVYVQIGGAAFAHDDKLVQVDNLDKAELIGDYAFYGTALESVKLTNAEYIGSFAFADSAVKQVTLGEKLGALGDNPFSNCEISSFGRMQEKKFGETVIGTELVETYDISAYVKVIDGVLYQLVPNGLELISYPAAKVDKDYAVLDGTVRVSSQAFAFSQIKNVTLPKSLKTLGDKAFYGCKKLATVVFTGYEAPMLEEAFDSSYAVTENMATVNRKGISKYYMWTTVYDTTNYYYGATFVDYIGNGNGNVVMVKPSNGTGYDTFIFDHYFGAKVAGSAAPTDETLAVIEIIAQLPDAMEVTLSHEEQIVAARNAYEQLTVEQKALVENYSRLTDAEGTLEYIKPAPVVEPTESTEPEMNFMQKHFYIGYILFGVVAVAFVAYIVLTKFVKKGGNGSEESEEQIASENGESEE